ncbi:MAG: insulinase family protein, partial [Abitibacteriaceae bacterium]|nr:insulinase family protein [Abditibacteriaceae bacterium]
MTLIHGFELLHEQAIPELQTKAQLFRHAKTGAQLLSLQNDDENKAFGITFKTPPEDSTGVAHILEHSVLCGSRKFPLKEPFIELAKGSFKTFLNAMTGDTATYYPVASTNLQDFYNLIDVYLDCVLYPQLSPHTFAQEGWHYELETSDAPLAFKGVVFNEMKGYYSSPDVRLYNYAQQSLFPDNVYGFDSGGDPKAIPDLTYEYFKGFHQRFYHPSNARIAFYGDDPPEERLRLMDTWLRDFEPREIRAAIEPQPRFKEPKRFTHPYAVEPDGPNADKGMVMVGWMLDQTVDPEALLALSIFGYVLIQTPASPLRKALLDSKLGEEVVGGENGGLQHSFYAGLKGIAVEDAAKIEQLIFDTLREQVQNGIDPQTVEAAMNTIEFHLRENNTGSFPRGLALMFRALETWIYDGNPFDVLAFEAPLAAIKARLAAGE